LKGWPSSFTKIAEKENKVYFLITVRTGDLRFSRRCWGRFVWDFKPGDWHIDTDVSERLNASIFRVMQT